MQPGRFTELFFLDEATAFAAGHRPCALCRREDYNRFGRIWGDLHPGQAGADAIDAQLDAERLAPDRRRNRTHGGDLDDLPDGAFVAYDGDAYLVRGRELLLWSPSGYAGRRPLPMGGGEVITPPSLVAVLATGWRGAVPLLHPSAA
jgi:hypothetical protein